MAEPQVPGGAAGTVAASGAGAGAGSQGQMTGGVIGAGAGGSGGTGTATGTAGAAGSGGTAGSGMPQAGSQASGGASGMPIEPSAGTGGIGEPDPPDMPQTCPASSALRPGETTQTIQVGSAMRRFILHVPASYTGQTPVPLIIDFHGILMNSTLQRNFSGFAQLSETEGFIVAFPEGTDTAFNVGICCTSSTAVDDVAFARTIIQHLSQQGCIDQKRVHATGYSMGGGMAMKLACDAADVFASIAYSAFDLMPEEDWACSPSRPISALQFRSTGDPIVAYNGAVNTIPPNGNPNLVTFIGAQANFARWASLDGCTDAAMQAGGGCEYHRQCSEGVEVGLCTKQGGGHDYMDAAAAWNFLKQHTMP